MKQVTILGSTGSIGQQALEVILAMPAELQVVGLTAQRNVRLLAKQAIAFGAKYAAIGDPTLLAELKDLLAGTKIHALAGHKAIEEVALVPADITISAIVGIAGLLPTMAALTHGKIVALACKEALVCAGSIMLKLAHHHRSTILPIDSEHNAIFQLFAPAHAKAVQHITLTASGGPFLYTPLEQIARMTKTEALRHPNWSMGAKITIDSATMVNKVLEMVEARYLFALEAKQISIIIHPESIVHGLVHYQDGSVLAQLGNHDMRMPIQYALTWPERAPATYPVLDLQTLAQLRFFPAEEARFPVIALADYLLKEQQAASIIFNAANEVAVAAFLQDKIGFTAIADTSKAMLAATALRPINNLEDIAALDQEARARTQELLGLVA